MLQILQYNSIFLLHGDAVAYLMGFEPLIPWEHPNPAVDFGAERCFPLTCKAPAGKSSLTCKTKDPFVKRKDGKEPFPFLSFGLKIDVLIFCPPV